MKCCKCGKQEDYLTFDWMKIKPETCSPYKVSDSVLRIGMVESEPYYILCPDCYNEIFKDLPYVKDVIETKQSVYINQKKKER